MSRIFAIITILVSQGCTTNVLVEGSVPTPLVNKIPARIGVYYADEFRTFSHKEEIREGGNWDIDLGAQNLTFFSNLLGSLFLSVRQIGAPPHRPEDMAELDGVLIPRIEKYGFLTPNISGLKFYSASIEYRIALYDKAGKKVGDWNIIGYGKSEGGMFSADQAVNEATVLAIRDGGARIAIELIDQPAVGKWVKGLGVIGPYDDGGQSETMVEEK